MLFFFFIDAKFSRVFFKTVNHIARKINRVSIFENTFFSDSLHDFNSFTSSFFKRSSKRFFNDITTNESNKSTKKKRDRSSKSINKSHASKKSRVESHATFYAFFSSLSASITSSHRRRRRSRFQSSTFFIFFSSSFSSSASNISFFFDQFFRSSIHDETEKNFLQNVLRDFDDEKNVIVREFDSKSDAFVEYHDIDEYVSSKMKIEENQKKIEEFEKKAHESFIRTIRSRDRSKTKKRQNKRLRCK